MLLACLPWARMGWMQRHSTCLKPILGPECAATPCATLARRQMLPHHTHTMQLRMRNLTQVRPGSLTGASNPCPQLTNPEPHLTNPEPHLGDPTNPPNHPPNPTHPAGPGGAQAHAGAKGGGHGACRPGEGPPGPSNYTQPPPTSEPPHRAWPEPRTVLTLTLIGGDPGGHGACGPGEGPRPRPLELYTANPDLYTPHRANYLAR